MKAKVIVTFEVYERLKGCDLVNGKPPTVKYIKDFIKKDMEDREYLLKFLKNENKKYKVRVE